MFNSRRIDIDMFAGSEAGGSTLAPNWRSRSRSPGNTTLRGSWRSLQDSDASASTIASLDSANDEDDEKVSWWKLRIKLLFTSHRGDEVKYREEVRKRRVEYFYSDAYLARVARLRARRDTHCVASTSASSSELPMAVCNCASDSGVSPHDPLMKQLRYSLNSTKHKKRLMRRARQEMVRQMAGVAELSVDALKLLTMHTENGHDWMGFIKEKADDIDMADRACGTDTDEDCDASGYMYAWKRGRNWSRGTSVPFSFRRELYRSSLLKTSDMNGMLNAIKDCGLDITPLYNGVSDSQAEEWRTQTPRCDSCGAMWFTDEHMLRNCEYIKCNRS